MLDADKYLTIINADREVPVHSAMHVSSVLTQSVVVPFRIAEGLAIERLH